MRLALLHTAVVMRAALLLARPLRSARTGCGSAAGASAARRMASSGIRPRLGDAHGDAHGEGMSSGMHKLGETGLKWLSAMPGDCIKLGES